MKLAIVEKITRQFFNKCDLQLMGYAAASKVPDTPYDRQTYVGARNRALDSKAHLSQGDYFVGLESGLIDRYGHIFEEAWAVVIGSKGEEYYGYSSGLKVPNYILNRMNDLHMEHCDAMLVIEEEFGNLPNNTWGTYSGGAILREVSLEEALRNAFIQVTASRESFYSR